MKYHERTGAQRMAALVGAARLSGALAAGRRRWRLIFPLAAAALLAGLLTGVPTAQASCGNPVACENALPGTPQSQWDITSSQGSTIYGFATPFSVNVGQTIQFKIKSPAKSYAVDIYRVGYYGGDGARLEASVTPNVSVTQSQPACSTNTTTGLVDCGNWGVSASWTVPTTAVSGVYFAHIYRTDGTSDANQIMFVVRNDASHSDIIFKTSDETWQAYNTWGGYSLYQGTATGSPWCCSALDPGRAVQVSYNRPFTTRFNTGTNGEDFFFYAEYPMIRFLEANGYDVSYTDGASVAADAGGTILQQHKIVMSTGHDEYWSGPEVANVTAARNAGVSLAFFSGNEVYWKTRWAADSSGTAYRTLITYKESLDSTQSDPADPPTWTGEWADPRFSPPADGGQPQNGLTGQLWQVNSGTYAIQVPYQYAKLRFWRNTSVANLTSGQTATMPNETLGYEWDEDIDNGYRPAGLIDMSSTTQTPQVSTDYQEDLASIPVTHHLTLYRASSGALVFGAGTVQWAWGLDSTHDGDSNNPPSPAMQQATINLLADMHAQPTTIISGVTQATASTDTTPPTSTITSPAAGANLTDGASVTISGSATDSGGGLVAGVEVSTDGGNTWHPVTTMSTAATSVTWSYTWIAHGSPSTTIESRATDDSGNVETPSAGVSVNTACPCSIWGPNVTPAASDTDSGDGSSVELGVKFKSDIYASVSGIRFYKASTNTGTHIGNLWTASGQLLASATFTNETKSGWQQVSFSRPVLISPNTTYVASYFAPNGHYSQTEQFFYPPLAGGATLDAPPLHALRSTVSSSNGVYVYSGSSAFPTNTFNGENYWVDVVFAPTTPPGQPANVTATAGYASAAVNWTAPTTGGPVTTYTVTPYIGTTAQTPVTVTGNPAPTSTTVGGLTNGTTYTFTVTASNPVGSGPVSASSNAVTPSSGASLVFNGGFENGLAPWAASGVSPPTVTTTKAHSGTASALLGTVSGTEPLGDSSLSQSIAVPSSGTTTLSFWYWPATADQICSGSACVYDWQEAQIRSTSGATLASVFKSNSNAQTWTQVTFDLTPYAGQTIQLWFNVHEDGSSPADDTSMYLDDVSATNSQPTAPGAPTGATATAGNGSATVSWTAPSNGGSPITSYTVTPYIGTTAQTPVTVTGGPPATSTTVSGLTNGTTYTFTVSATNAIGTGPASAPSNAVTPSAPTAPGAPTNVTASAGNASASVSWTAPSNGGSPITSYTVTPYIGSTAQTPTVVSGSPPATSTTVTGLTNGTTYTFTVSATNSVGTGPSSSPSNAVTPSAQTVPAFVQQAGTHASSVSSISATPGANVTAGDRLIVMVGIWASGNPTAKSVTDSAGDPFTEVLHFTASDGTEMSVWTAPITNGGGTKPAITATPTAQADMGIEVLEYSGLSTATGATAVDQMSHASGTTGSAATVQSGATPATTSANELAIGFYADSGFGDTLTSGSGFTKRANVSPTGDMEFLAEDEIAGLGATPDATAGTGASTTWLMATVVFKHS